MKVTRVYTGNDQQSHFEELFLVLEDAQYGQLTASVAVKNIKFGRN